MYPPLSLTRKLDRKVLCVRADLFRDVSPAKDDQGSIVRFTDGSPSLEVAESVEQVNAAVHNAIHWFHERPVIAQFALMQRAAQTANGSGIAIAQAVPPRDIRSN